MFRTFNGKRMSDSAYEKRVRKLATKALGANYLFCAYDQTDCRYDFGCGRSPDECAARIIEKRGMQPAERIHVRIWRDEHSREIELRPWFLPESVALTVRSAFDRGASHGTVFHWEPEKRDCRETGDVARQFYLWEKL